MAVYYTVFEMLLSGKNINEIEIDYFPLAHLTQNEECSMASADMQWLFYSGEQIVAHGLLF